MKFLSQFFVYLIKNLQGQNQGIMKLIISISILIFKYGKRSRMSLTYKIGAGIVRLLGFKKCF